MDWHACQTLAVDDAYMPTRILDIGMVDDGTVDKSSRTGVRLVKSDGITGKRDYACLSYRWGSTGENSITTRATYEQHRTGIAFKDLTLAFQDMVHIARRLGVRYLWIDSLCIVQDDEEDWRAESKTMATVYSKALFTLARHVDSTTSLRSLPKPQIHTVSDPSVSPPVFARKRAKHLWDAFDSEPSPLLKRGWVYQERLLSPRIIHFTDFEIVWECCQRLRCQCSPKYIPIYADEIPKIKHVEALGTEDRTAIVDEAEIRERWRGIIQEYSRLDLTRLSDRLPAIQGCAEQIRPYLRDSYSFGLWTKGSGLDLAWSTFPSGADERRPHELFHVPTWSWASVGGQVRYHDRGDQYVKVVFEHAQDDPCPGQTSAYWLITGQMMPARLKIDHSRKVDIEVSSDYSMARTSASLLVRSGSGFRPDFALHTDDWNDESWYDISIVRIGRNLLSEIFLVLWRYGKSIPGSGQERQTKDGYPIYQRVGLIEEYRRVSVLDWSKVSQSTIALE
jgi:hypothetical protein